MLHLFYILAFTIIAFVAISNLLGSLINLSAEARRDYRYQPKTSMVYGNIPHPELLDEQGRLVNEPLLVVRSVSVEDARQKLDALYNSSPSSNRDDEERA